MRKKVLYISGSRADYGPARGVLRAIHASDDFELGIMVTSMHLDPTHGETWKEIEADGLNIVDRISGRESGDSLEAMSATTGIYLTGMSHSLARLKPDIVLVLGDRGEQLAGAIAAAFQNFPVVHLCGGSVSGSIDDSIRHAITKLSHYHLPAMQEHADRIIQMGEDPSTVTVVGLPGADLRPDARFSRDEICRIYNLPEDMPYLLIVQHSVTHSEECAGAQITETLEAVAGLPYHCLLGNPNDDAGGRAILAKMVEYSKRYPNLHVLSPVASRDLHSSIVKHAAVQIGNSSSGIVEAASVALPVVNIGDRQSGREYLAPLLNVNYDRSEISQAIDTALHDQRFRQAVLDHSRTIQAIDTPGRVLQRLRSVDRKVAQTAKKGFRQ